MRVLVLPLLCLLAACNTTYVPYYPNMQPITMAPPPPVKEFTPEEIFGNDGTPPTERIMVRGEWLQYFLGAHGQVVAADQELRRRIAEYNDKIIIGYIQAKRAEYATSYSAEGMAKPENWVKGTIPMTESVPTLPSPGER